MPHIAMLREGKHNGHKSPQIYHWQHHKCNITQCLAYECSKCPGIHSASVHAVVSQAALTRSGAHTCYAEQKGLLQYQCQYAGNNRRPHSHRIVANGNHPEWYRHHASRRWILELIYLAHLHLSSEFGVDCGDGCNYVFISQNHRHIAICLHPCLLAATHIARKIARQVHYAVCLAFCHTASGILHIHGIIGHAHLLGGVEHTGILSRHGCATLVYHHYGHFFHHFAIIDERIKYGICQRQEDDKNHRPHITEHEFIFVYPDLSYVFQYACHCQ